MNTWFVTVTVTPRQGVVAVSHFPQLLDDLVTASKLTELTLTCTIVRRYHPLAYIRSAYKTYTYRHNHLATINGQKFLGRIFIE